MYICIYGYVADVQEGGRRAARHGCRLEQEPESLFGTSKIRARYYSMYIYICTEFHSVILHHVALVLIFILGFSLTSLKGIT